LYKYYDPNENIMIVYTELPSGINEAVTPNADGSYTIFISTMISADKQKQAYAHALWHIKNDDFSRPDVQSIETVAHDKDKEKKHEL